MLLLSENKFLYSSVWKPNCIRALEPESASLAVNRMMYVPAGSFSLTLPLRDVVLKTGGLSLTSRMLMCTLVVDSKGGVPRSDACTVIVYVSWCSRSGALPREIIPGKKISNTISWLFSQSFLDNAIHKHQP